MSGPMMTFIGASHLQVIESCMLSWRKGKIWCSASATSTSLHFFHHMMGIAWQLSECPTQDSGPLHSTPSGKSLMIGKRSQGSLPSQLISMEPFSLLQGALGKKKRIILYYLSGTGLTSEGAAGYIFAIQRILQLSQVNEFREGNSSFIRHIVFHPAADPPQWEALQ